MGAVHMAAHGVMAAEALEAPGEVWREAAEREMVVAVMVMAEVVRR